jgi:8-oxo-dGTP diphosphatase
MKSLPPKAKPEVTVDVVAFTVEDSQLKVLLVRRAREPFVGTFTLPGGFMWEGETSAQAALRNLRTKSGVDSNIFSEQLYTFDDPQRDKRGHIISVAYMALVPLEKISKHISLDVKLAPVADVGQLPFDHSQILAYATKRLRTKLGYSNVAYSLLPKLFTLSQLQDVYEVILGHPIDKRNFRKKILSLGIIEPTEQKLTGRKHRPARLFKFAQRSYAELEEPIF